MDLQWQSEKKLDDAQVASVYAQPARAVEL